MWSWDITELKGPVKGTHFDLYVMLDFFSPKAIRHRVQIRESDALASEPFRVSIAHAR